CRAMPRNSFPYPTRIRWSVTRSDTKSRLAGTDSTISRLRTGWATRRSVPSKPCDPEIESAEKWFGARAFLNKEDRKFCCGTILLFYLPGRFDRTQQEWLGARNQKEVSGAA